MNWNCSRSSGLIDEDVVEVLLVPGDEVVDADDGLAEIEQLLEQRRADEAGDAGDEPAARRVDQVRADFVVAGHVHRLQSRMPRGGFGLADALLTSITTPPSRTRAKMPSTLSMYSSCATARISASRLGRAPRAA